MKKLIVSISFILIAKLGFSQSWIDNALNEVEQNSPSIKSGLLWKEAKQADSRTDLTPENPFISAGWFPAEQKGVGMKKTWGVSQAFDFPTVYFQKVKKASISKEIAEMEYKMLRQEVLLEAKITIIELIFEKQLNQRLEDRVKQTEQVLGWFKKRLETGDGSVLDYNNAQVRLLEISDKLNLSNSTIDALKQSLKSLNGGKLIAINDSISLNFVLNDSIIADIKQNDPRFLLLKLNNRQSLQDLNLAKNEWLPNFEVGFESEETKVETFRGLKVGIAIPLWRNAGKVKAAKISKMATEAESISVEEQLILETQQILIETQNNLTRCQTLKRYLSIDNSYQLLRKSLETGNISAINFFNETEYLFGLNEKLTEAEKDFAIGVAKLERFKL